MKTLIYTMAFGQERYFDLAARFVAHLRRKGYAGDVYILTDREYDIPGAVCCDVSGGEGYFRLRLPKEVQAEEYDRIMCCDSDVWIRKWHKLLETPSNFAASYEMIPLAECEFNLRFHRAHDPRDGLVLNAGLFIVSGREFRGLADKWNLVPAMFSDNPRWPEREDQSALQWLVSCGYLSPPDPLRVHFPFKGEGSWSFPFRADAVHLNGIETMPHLIPRIMEAIGACA